MLKRWEIINDLIQKYNYTDYLEVGVKNGECFEQIICKNKTSVDPNPGQRFKITHKLTSDEYFNNNKTDKYDIIFIDGLHHADQVFKDIKNALEILSENGTIVCHDMKPRSYIAQYVPRRSDANDWNGDCWKSWIWLRTEHTDLSMFVVDTDEGCGIIRRGTQEILVCDPDITHDDFESDINNLLSLKTPTQYKQWLKI